MTKLRIGQEISFVYPANGVGELRHRRIRITDIAGNVVTGKTQESYYEQFKSFAVDKMQNTRVVRECEDVESVHFQSARNLLKGMLDSIDGEKLAVVFERMVEDAEDVSFDSSTGHITYKYNKSVYVDSHGERVSFDVIAKDDDAMEIDIEDGKCYVNNDETTIEEMCKRIIDFCDQHES